MEQESITVSASPDYRVTKCRPEISVVITAYNYGRFLGKAIESVLTQDFNDFELIILNNASTDDTDNVVRRFLSDSRIRYISNETNIGALANCQKGLALAGGNYILFLSADDFLLSGALSMLYQAITSDQSVDFVYAKYMFVDSDGNTVNDNINHPGWLPYGHKNRINELADLLQFDCYISLLTVLFKREILDSIGKFTDRVRVMDYELFLRLAARGCTALFLNEIIAAFRLHGNQMSVGGDVISSGSQVNDQLTLIEMYVTDENFTKLAGYQAGIIKLLALKIEAFNRSPNRSIVNYAALQERIQAAMARIARIWPAVPDRSPMVSVIVPTLDRPDMVVRAVKSILGQTYPDFEIIVVNDGGRDIREIFKPLAGADKILYIQHEKTRERSAARNSALEAARGKYIAYLDDDDRFYPDHLRVLVNFLESHQVKVAYTDAYRALEELENGTYVVKQRQLLYSCAFDPDRLLVENMFPNLCVMHARECIDKVGLFDETLQTHEDWELWLRMSRYYCFHHIPVVTAEYSYRNDMTNTTTARLAEFNETRERIYRQYHHFSQLNPAVLKAQKKTLEKLGAAVAPSMTVFDFMQTITRHVEMNNFTAALSYYDKHRVKFSTLPELEKFDSLMGVLRSKNMA